MSMQDRLSAYPPLTLLNIASGLSLTTLVLSRSYAYNFPLLLFGMVAHEMHSSSELLRQFLNLTLWSAIFDVLALISASDSFFTKILAFIVLLLKAPIGVTCSNLLRERGGEFRMGGWLPQGAVGGGGGGGAAGGQSNWTMPSIPAMPGGFGGSAQPAAHSHQAQNQPSQSSFPSGGGYRLGGEDGGGGDGGAPAAPPPGRNGYSSIA